MGFVLRLPPDNLLHYFLLSALVAVFAQAIIHSLTNPCAITNKFGGIQIEGIQIGLHQSIVGADDAIVSITYLFYYTMCWICRIIFQGVMTFAGVAVLHGGWLPLCPIATCQQHFIIQIAVLAVPMLNFRF